MVGNNENRNEKGKAGANASKVNGGKIVVNRPVVSVGKIKKSPPRTAQTPSNKETPRVENTSKADTYKEELKENLESSKSQEEKRGERSDMVDRRAQYR